MVTRTRRTLLAGVWAILPALGLCAWSLGVPRSLVAQAAVDVYKPILLTVSGGVSLGSYQAGLTWSVLQGMELAQDPSGKANQRILRSGMTLAAVTGASAGNINAMITAIEWCDRTPQARPEESLFWKIWVRTGYEQLLVENPYRNTGSESESLFHRRFFQEHHYPLIQARMREADPRPGCHIPVGITLTKLVPGSVRLGQLDIPTQRYVSVFSLREARGADGRSRLRFSLPHPGVVADSSLGKRAFIPVVDETYLSDSLVFELNEASSAFPMAFEPKTLRYYDPDLSCPEDTRELGFCVSEGRFLDGGVFDNNPLDLALGIYNHVRVHFPEGSQESRTRLVYVDAGSYRDSLKVARDEAEEDPFQGRGIGAAAALLKGAIPAARKYELQSLARTLARDSLEHRADWIRVTSRSYPIVGEHIANFGAFLGMPFREFDFYVGMYDGLHFVAKEICADLGRDDVADPCVAETLASLITEEELHLGEVAPHLMRRLFAAEFGDSSAPAVPAPSEDPEHIAVLDALFDSNGKLFSPPEADRCEGLGFVERLLCRDGFDLLLSEFSDHDGVRATIKRWAEPEECRREHAMTAPEHCRADRSLVELLDNRHAFLSQTMEKLIRQLWRVEDQLRREGVSNSSQLLEFTELWFRSAGGRYQRGLETEPSTIPSGVEGWRRALQLFPYYAQISAGTKGGEWGYRPTYHASNGFAFVAPLGVHWVRPTEFRDEEWRWRGGVGFLWKRSNLLLSGVQITGDVFHTLPWWGENDPRPLSNETVVWGGTVSAYFLGGKATIALRVIPRNDTEMYNGDDVAVLLGIADLNGVLYWMTRGVLR